MSDHHTEKEKPKMIMREPLQENEFGETGYLDSEGGFHTDDGTIADSVDMLAQAVIGHRISSVGLAPSSPRKAWHDWEAERALILVLDNGTRVTLIDTYDCCAHTKLEKFLLNVDKVDHLITGVRVEDTYRRWYITADLGDILQMDVSWSSGNPFYYVYGFEIVVGKAEG